MYSVLNKDMIEMEIVPFIPKTKRGFALTVPLTEIVNAILHKLKTGVQWNRLPVRAIFSGVSLSWQSVCHHYRKWCLSGAWKDCWAQFLKKHWAELDLSGVELDGSHTPAIRGGKGVEYKGGERTTTNAPYLTDRQGASIGNVETSRGQP